MADGFGPYHVPQQTRRDKLRVLSQNLDPSIHGSAGFYPLYGHSLLPPDLLTTAPPVPPPTSGKTNGSTAAMCVSKEESPSFMGFPYLDPNSSAFQPINPATSIQDFNGRNNNHQNPNPSPNSFPYNLPEFDNSYSHGAEVVLYKPQPVTLACRQDQSRLSLSLSSHHPAGSSSPSELNLQRFGSDVYAVPSFASGSGSSSVSNEVSRSLVPLGPFTGYASVLKGSRFLKPAQQLLQDFCDVGRVICAEKMSPGSDSSAGLMGSPMENWGETGIASESFGDADLPPESRRKKSTLLSMLDEVYKRYKRYYLQMQAVVASFECVAGLGNAAPFANLALKSVSQYFKCLKNVITAQLSDKPHDPSSRAKGGAVRHGGTDQGLPCQRPFHEHQSVWRPQRGLPERAVTVLRAWLFEHFLHPYPTDTDKLMLAKQTGLSRNQVLVKDKAHLEMFRSSGTFLILFLCGWIQLSTCYSTVGNQVSNWFINARVRLWKPMVEEIHMLETKQAQNRDCSRSSHPSSSSNSLGSENPSTSTQRVQDMASKRSRNELPDLPESQQPLSASYNSSLSQVAPMSVSMTGSSTGVSLTLGLHQNNRVGLSEPLPINAAQRFGLGLEVSGEEYVMGGFEAQNRHFGGGQLLRDFVG